MTNTIESPRDRLERLRAEVADRKDAALSIRPGDEFHVLRTGISIATGRGLLSAAHQTTAGETIIATAEMIAASFSASGRSWMSIIGDDAAQFDRWGEIRFRPGRAPEDIQRWNEWGDGQWSELREQARKEAWAQPTAEARADALAAVEKKFGPAAPTSTIISTSPDPSIAAAEAQRKALDEGGTRLAWAYEAREPGQAGDRR
ncbi:hypothetical protein [Microbacterium sp. APC 3901]|uniref:hypothetical protein n=1 Tax=Microbacterium sp. APC 3901 TaxID=3035192 RepID=UPI0025B2BFBB|nr:hypothetical protein [Microbacterium sp. APC 3901]MDN3443732.1 hypothetical protein [Microbacterium sp. APC 3901]